MTEVIIIRCRDFVCFLGLHGEGSTLFTLMMVYMWDIVFHTVIADVFYNDYQTAPLDLYTDDFYTNRKVPIDEFLSWMNGASWQVGAINHEHQVLLKKSTHPDNICS